MNRSRYLSTLANSNPKRDEKTTELSYRRSQPKLCNVLYFNIDEHLMRSSVIHPDTAWYSLRLVFLYIHSASCEVCGYNVYSMLLDLNTLRGMLRLTMWHKQSAIRVCKRQCPQIQDTHTEREVDLLYIFSPIMYRCALRE